MKDSLLQHDTVALNAAKDALHIIDQTKLPGELVFLDLRTQAEIWHAIQTLQVRGYHFQVFADETRPLLQGARLTASELHAAGVDVTLICDNMAATVMKKGWVQAVFVGCDRVAANGDAANKIGTLGVAILAKRFGIPFYICAPSSTIDLNTPTGAEIPIEERDGDEISTMWYAKPMAAEGVKTFNPAFDVTDADLITGIVTEYGVARAPYDLSLKEIFARKAANPL